MNASVLRAGRVAVIAMLLWTGSALNARAQGLVTITIPASVTFNVSNVTVNTTGNPAAATISFNTLVILPIQVFRISVRADAANFTSPAPGTAIPANRLQWTTSNVTGGTGSSGTLSTSYTQLFQSAALQLSGGLDVRWVLQAPGGGIRSGNHTLVVRYRLEAI